MQAALALAQCKHAPIHQAIHITFKDTETLRACRDTTQTPEVLGVRLVTLMATLPAPTEVLPMETLGTPQHTALRA